MVGEERIRLQPRALEDPPVKALITVSSAPFSEGVGRVGRSNATYVQHCSSDDSRVEYYTIFDLIDSTIFQSIDFY